MRKRVLISLVVLIIVLGSLVGCTSGSEVKDLPDYF